MKCPQENSSPPQFVPTVWPGPRGDVWPCASGALASLQESLSGCWALLLSAPVSRVVLHGTVTSRERPALSVVGQAAGRCLFNLLWPSVCTFRGGCWYTSLCAQARVAHLQLLQTSQGWSSDHLRCALPLRGAVAGLRSPHVQRTQQGHAWPRAARWTRGKTKWVTCCPGLIPGWRGSLCSPILPSLS